MSDARARSAAASCRSCGRTGLELVVDLGRMPPSDRLVPPERAAQPDPRFPLELAFCPGCTLVQILETVDPSLLFADDFPYFSSFSPALLAHSRENALELIESRKLGPHSLAVELASNDGYLLKNFVERGVPVLGIDPARAQVDAAKAIGVESVCAFFDVAFARRLRDEGRLADVIVANNVLAHVADTNGFVEGVATLLKDDGVASIEVPYVRELIDKCEFDTIYLEHLCYFSVTALDALFRRHGLFLNDVRRLKIHGGSLRLYVEKVERVGPAVRGMLDEERAAGLVAFPYYRDFGRRVDELKAELRALVLGLKAEGRRVAAYGAAAKGAMLLNACGLGHEVIDFVVDRNVHKHGKAMPGVRVPVRPVEALLDEMPDDVLILPWNFRDEILAQQHEYLRRGGRFIVPVPKPEVVALDASSSKGGPA